MKLSDPAFLPLCKSLIVNVRTTNKDLIHDKLNFEIGSFIINANH